MRFTRPGATASLGSRRERARNARRARSAVNISGDDRAETLRALLRREVALGLGSKLVADEKLPHRGGTEERWKKDGVKAKASVVPAIAGPLVPAHGVGKGRRENFVVAPHRSTEKPREIGELLLDVIAQQIASPILAVRAEALRLSPRNRRDVPDGPDLPVGTGIARAHHDAPVLEDLDVGGPLLRREPLGLRSPRGAHRLAF